jgi:hypothetical protein
LPAFPPFLPQIRQAVQGAGVDLSTCRVRKHPKLKEQFDRGAAGQKNSPNFPN